MSVLFVMNDVTQPSVLWARRMLDGLGGDVAVLATEVEPDLGVVPFETCFLREAPTRRIWRLLFRLGLTDTIPRTRRAIGELLSAAEDPRVSVVLVHYLTHAVAFDRVWRSTPKPVFVHCHGYDVTWDLRAANRVNKPAHGRGYVERVRALPQNVQFIANSRTTWERLREIGLAPERIHVKHLGVPVPAEPTPANPGSELTFLYLGRLIDCKGPDLLIQAFDLACSRGLAGRLVIAGDGPERARCAELWMRSPNRARIELLGAVDDDAGERLRSQADVFTAHNRMGPVSGQEEAFGVSVVEAMAAGLPVVAGASGGLLEIVEHGREGLLVDPGDVEGHAEALLRLAADSSLRARLGRNGRQRVLDNFCIESEICELRKILGLRGSGAPATRPADTGSSSACTKKERSG